MDIQTRQISSPSERCISRGCPILSVVIGSVDSVRQLRIFLDVISGQISGKPVEVIVAHSGDASNLDGLRMQFANVDFLLLPAKSSLPQMLGEAIRRSQGEIIAITDSTCPPEQHWIDAVIEAHRSPHVVIGGAVELDSGAGLVDLATYFCDYAQFMQPVIEGIVRELPGNNITLKRSVFQEGEEHVRDAFWKTFWCQRLQQEGIALFSTPSMVVKYNRHLRFFPFAIRRFHHGRCFSAMRVRRASMAVRAMYTAGSILLPLLFFVRLIRTVALKRRHVGKFLLSLPVSAVALGSWSIGEFFGYLGGAGRSCSHVR